MKTSVTFTHGATYSHKASQEIYSHLVGVGAIKPSPENKFQKSEHVWEQGTIKTGKEFSVARAMYIKAKLKQLFGAENIVVKYSFPTESSTRFTIETTPLSIKPSVTLLEPSEGFCGDNPAKN